MVERLALPGKPAAAAYPDHSIQTDPFRSCRRSASRIGARYREHQATLRETPADFEETHACRGYLIATHWSPGTTDWICDTGASPSPPRSRKSRARHDLTKLNPPTAVAEPWSMRVDLRDVRSLERDTEFLRVLTDMIGATVFWEGRLCVRPQLTGVFSTFENPLTREADGHPGPRFLLLCATHRRTARNSWSSTRQQIGRLSRRIVPTACGRGRKRELGNICCRIIRSVHIPPCPASVAIAYARSDYP